MNLSQKSLSFGGSKSIDSLFILDSPKAGGKTIGGVLYMHSFPEGGTLLSSGLASLNRTGKSNMYFYR